MNIAQQIAALEATRKEKAARLEEITQKSIDEARSLDDAEAQEFDSVELEVKRLDDDLARFRKLLAMQADNAKSVETEGKKAAAQPLSFKSLDVRAKHNEKLEPGVGMARFARVKLLSHIDAEPVDKVAKSLYPHDEGLQTVIKAPVDAAHTQDANWAGNLINEGSMFADFVEFLRPRTLLGQIEGQLRRLPFDTPVLIQNSGATANWVAEGDAKPVTKWSWTRTKLAPLKVAAIAAATEEQLRRASVAADMLFRDELARAVGSTIDTTFADPSVAAVADESPGSIFNGVTGLTPNGDTGIIGVRCDIAEMLNAHNDANLNFDGMFWVMSGRNAIALSQMTNEIGNMAYPTVTPTGGTLAGFPVYVSNYAPTDSTGSFVALVKGSEIFIGDEGGFDVRVSREASLLMDNAPNMNSTTPTGASLVSLWQTNSVGFLVERYINWARRRDAAVAWMNVAWDACEVVS